MSVFTLLAVLFVLFANVGLAADLTAKFVYGCEPRASWCSELTCTFDGASSTAATGRITGYRWYFRRYLKEDGESEYATRTGARVTHTYTNTRCRSYTYYAMLEVTDSAGNRTTHTEQVNPSRRLDLPPENQKPVADFSASCDEMDCFFDAGASRDPDGHIASYSWSFGDGGTGNGDTIHRTYATPGTYTVRLTVADNQGATAQRAKNISVIPPGFNLTSTARIARGGLQKVDLRWTGAKSQQVDVFRDGVWVATTPNDGAYTDPIDLRGRGTYKHRVCERNTRNCSNESAVVFE